MEGARRKRWAEFVWGFLFQTRIVLAVLGVVFLARTGASWLSIATIGLAVVLTIVSMCLGRSQGSRAEGDSTELHRGSKR